MMKKLLSSVQALHPDRREKEQEWAENEQKMMMKQSIEQTQLIQEEKAVDSVIDEIGTEN